MSTKLVIRKGAVIELLKSAEVQADLRRRAQAIATRAGEGHRVDSDVGPRRARAAVITDTHRARRAEAKSRTLSSAIDAGR